MKRIDEIYTKHAPSTFQSAKIVVSQGVPQIPPPSTVTSIPNYTTPQVTTTMQQVSHVTPFLLPTSIPSSFVALHVPSTTFTPLSVPFTSPNITYTPSPFSLPPHTTYPDPIITQLFNTISSMQQKISTISQSQNAPPAYHVLSSTLSLEILCTQIPQGI